MLTRHETSRLVQYCDGELSTMDARAVEEHLSRCSRCLHEMEEIRFAGNLVRQLAVVSAPAAVWNGIESAAPDRLEHREPAWALRWATACILAIAIAGGLAYWWTRGSVHRPWEVADLTNGGSISRMAEGEWIETGTAARRRIVVGDIGIVDVEPGARVRLGGVRPTEYRLSLARGTISAQIDAPPRLFVVDTPASTVVDLGCAYTMTVDDDGGGRLLMTEGWAALEWQGRESLVPAGAAARTRPRVGPGIPVFDDASPAFHNAAAAFDFADGGGAAIDTMLKEARVRDTLTLWHLISRVAPSDRERVYERIASLTPPPPTIARERALQLDAETLRLWREELAWTW